MANVTKNHTFSSGTTIVASEHNDNFNTIYNEFNGGISNSNIASGAAIGNAKLNLASISQSVAFTGPVTFTGTTIADLGTVTTANIDGGTMDGVQIGGTTATGELIVNDSSDGANGLGSQGTSGQVLTSAGAGVNPTWGSSTSSTVETFTSDDTWTCPAGVTSILLTMIGAGGAGGDGGTSGTAGGGGAAGSLIYQYPVTVVPTTVYTLQVGVGGAAVPNGDGTVGEDTIFDTGGLAITAPGGGFGNEAVSSGGDGTGGVSSGRTTIGETALDGAGANSNDGGAGGVSAGIYYKQGDGGTALSPGNGGGGGGGGTIYGAGGVGATNGGSAATDGTAYGAGGGGGAVNNRTAGDGADGVIIIYY